MGEEAFLFQFLNGLPKPYMQQIIVQNPRNAEEALAIARTLEQLDNISKIEDLKIALEALKKEMEVSAAKNNNKQDENKELKQLITEMTRSFQTLSSTLAGNNIETEQRQGQQNRQGGYNNGQNNDDPNTGHPTPNGNENYGRNGNPNGNEN